MPENWKTVPARYIITFEQNVRFKVGIYFKKIQLNGIKNGLLVANHSLKCKKTRKQC